MKKSLLAIIALSSCLFLQQCKDDDSSEDPTPAKTNETAYAPDNSLVLNNVQYPLTNIVAESFSEDYYVEGSFLFQQTSSVLLGSVSLYFDSSSTAPADGAYNLSSNAKQQSHIMFSEMNGDNAQLYVAQSGKLDVDIVGGKKRYRVKDALFRQASGVGETKTSFTMVED